VTRRIVVFRFDRDPLVCRSRIALLRQFNPGVCIHGMYGGPHGYRRAAFRLAGRQVLGVDSLWTSSPGSARWNWLHGDLALAAWYRDVGHALAFDVAHVIEWDLLLLDGLARVFASVPDEAVGLTALTPLSRVEGHWEWIDDPVHRREWEALLDEARREWAYNATPFACWGPGPCLPKMFLERFAAVDLPEHGHDELRLPLVAQALGFPLADTGLRRDWLDSAEDRFFNVGSGEITLANIRAEWSRPSGRRAFHPVRRRLRVDEVRSARRLSDPVDGRPSPNVRAAPAPRDLRNAARVDTSCTS
jgi:hypothetical protein